MTTKFLKEIVNFSGRELKTIWGWFATSFGFVSALFPSMKTYIGLFVIFMLFSVFSLVRSWSILRRKIIDVHTNGNRNFCIMIDDFIDNFKYNLKNKDTFAVALGFDRSLDLLNTSRGSMLEDFIKYLDEEHGLSIQNLQKRIDEERKVQNLEEVKLGDILCVELELNEKKIDLLLVVNSQKKKVDSIIRNDLLDGEDSRIMIIKLFRKCSKLKFDTLMLGAIGTNKLEFPYKIIITEIINAYIYCSEKKYSPQNVCLSLREQDMNQQSLEKREIINYIAQSMKFNIV